MIQDDLWADPKADEFGSVGIQSTVSQQYSTQPYKGSDVVKSQNPEQAFEMTLHFDIPHDVVSSSLLGIGANQVTSIDVGADLWAAPEEFQAQSHEIEKIYTANEIHSTLEPTNNLQFSPLYTPRIDNKYIAELSLSAFETSTIDKNEEFSDIDFSLDSFELLDIEAELLALEQVERDQEQRGTKREVKRGQATGWMGRCSILYINWEDEEKAQQEALERLGYTKIALSDATRSFVIQAARASSLTGKEERQWVAQLINARAYLAELPNDPSFDEKRAQAKAELAQIERFLVAKMQWVGVKKAPRFLGQGIEIDDLIQHAMLGVIKGVQAFDPSRNTHLLVTVNWWVFSLLNRAMASESRLIVLPAHLHEQIMHMKRQRNLLDRELGRFPTNEELANIIHISPQKLEELLQVDRRVYFLSRYTQREYIRDGYSFQAAGNAFSISEQDMFLDEIEQGSFKQEVNALLNDLNPREKLVLSLRYDLNDEIGGTRTLEEVGQILKVTRERVRQIEAKAFRKILSKYGLRRVKHHNQYTEESHGLSNSAIALLNILEPEERQVIELQYDIDGSFGRNRILEEVATNLPMTLEQVKNIAERGIKKIQDKLFRTQST